MDIGNNWNKTTYSVGVADIFSQQLRMGNQSAGCSAYLRDTVSRTLEDYNPTKTYDISFAYRRSFSGYYEHYFIVSLYGIHADYTGEGAHSYKGISLSFASGYGGEQSIYVYNGVSQVDLLSFPWSSGASYYVKIRWHPGGVNYKIWLAADPEPVGWTREINIPNRVIDGNSFVFHHNSSTQVTMHCGGVAFSYIDNLKITTVE
ncbi:MAG TPA: hypothetical protein PL088_04205 [Spirochaetota bacterium]|nr:hypothetical protein [Spirochaetota bacterium]